MGWLLSMALAASAIPLPPTQGLNPGIPPPWPDGESFDIPSVCFVLMTAEAEQRLSEKQTSRYEDTASGYFGAEVLRIYGSNSPHVIAKAKQVVADRPERYRLSCADAFAAGFAVLGRPIPR